MTRTRRPARIPPRSSALRAAAPEAALRESRRLRRWAWAGVACGVAVGGVAALPASLLVNAVAAATEDRVVLADATGSLWNGSALAVLTGGPGSRDASVLPSRITWRIRPRWNGIALHLQQDCCIGQGIDLTARAHLSGARIDVADAPGDGVLAQWPAGWLEGLGSLWKTVRPGGLLRLGSHQLAFVHERDGWRIAGEARLEIRQASARLTTLDTLGSYQLTLTGAPASDDAGGYPGAGAGVAGSPGAGLATPRTATPSRQAHLVLSTLDGALILDGSGDVGPSGARFRGQARAAPGAEDALANLLNIIGRRSGATSLISIG